MKNLIGRIKTFFEYGKLERDVINHTSSATALSSYTLADNELTEALNKVNSFTRNHALSRQFSSYETAVYKLRRIIISSRRLISDRHNGDLVA